MASSNKSPNKLLLVIAPIVVIGGIWGVKSIASSSQPPAGETQAAAGIDGKQMVDLQKPLKEGMEAIESGNPDRAKREYAEWKETWQSVEASFKQQSPDGNVKVERSMEQIDKTLVNASTPDKEGAIAAFKSLSEAVNVPTASAAQTAPTTEMASAAGGDFRTKMTDLQKPLVEGGEALESGNFDRAKREYAEWDETWKSVEASFKQASPDGYEKMEQGMTQVDATLVNAATPDKEGAIAAFKSLKDTIAATK